MPNLPESSSIPPAIERIVPAFRRSGWISFWVQVVIAVVATLIFAFSLISLAFSDSSAGRSQTINPGTGPGIFFALSGLIALAISIYWTYRYTRFAKQLVSPEAGKRPSKSDAVQLVQRGLIINLVGMLFNLMAAEAITGILLAKSLQSLGAFFSATGSITRLIQPLDIFVVLANTHSLVAHFVGILVALFLLRAIYRNRN